MNLFNHRNHIVSVLVLAAVATMMPHWPGCSRTIIKASFQVHDGDTRKPLTRAIVTHEETEIAAATDSNGYCDIPYLKPGKQTVTVTHEGYLSESFSFVLESQDTARQSFALYQNEPRTIIGLVTDAENGQPLAGATISIPEASLSALTQSDGTYILARVPHGHRELRINCPGYITRFGFVPANGSETTEVSFSLDDTTHAGALEGTVIDAETNGPLPDANVTLESLKMATTDLNGQYLIRGIPAGEYQVTASCDGYDPRTIPFRVVKGWTVTVDFKLSRRTGP